MVPISRALQVMTNINGRIKSQGSFQKLKTATMNQFNQIQRK